MVPLHLHRRTQHKRLGARIGEDIVAKRDKSAFFRVAPGRFFLREFLTDESIAEGYRQPHSHAPPHSRAGNVAQHWPYTTRRSRKV